MDVPMPQPPLIMLFSVMVVDGSQRAACRPWLGGPLCLEMHSIHWFTGSSSLGSPAAAIMQTAP